MVPNSRLLRNIVNCPQTPVTVRRRSRGSVKRKGIRTIPATVYDESFNFLNPGFNSSICSLGTSEPVPVLSESVAAHLLAIPNTT